MSTVESPVTQMVDTAVKSASFSGVTVPEADAIGRENRAVNRRISVAKMRIAKRDGDDVMSRRTACARSPQRPREDADQLLPDIASSRARQRPLDTASQRAFVMVLRPGGG